MECGTISELASSLESRFETAKTAFRLHISAGRDAEELDEMMASLQEIQKVMKQLRATVDQEKQDLEYAKSALASLRQERGRVEHLMANLPDRLPNQTAPPHIAAATETNRTERAESAAPAPRGSAPPTVACLTVAEFASVPQYMRGRGTRDQANSLLDEVNTVLSARYVLVRRPRTALSGPQKKLWLECRREENPQTKGRYFFTEDDFRRFKKTSLSKAMRQLLVVLRHVGRITTLRGPGTVVRHVLT